MSKPAPARARLLTDAIVKPHENRAELRKPAKSRR